MLRGVLQFLKMQRVSYHMTQGEYIAVEGIMLDLQNMALKMLLLKRIAERLDQQPLVKQIVKETQRTRLDIKESVYP